MTGPAERKEMRCRGKIHGVRKDYPNGESYIEVRCKDHWCTDREPGVVVFHYFDIETGALHHTRKYSNPPINTSTERGSSDETRKVNQQ